MTNAPPRCPCCGHLVPTAPCQRCDGTATSLDGRQRVRPGRGAALVDACRGLRDVHRATFALLHGRHFIGELRLPVTANALAFASLVLFGWLTLGPWFASWFHDTWWLFDGLRLARRDTGPSLLLLTCWLVLGPPLLDALVGAFMEPLCDAAERTMFGPRRGPPIGTNTPRLRERARVLAVATALLPLALLASLLPWIGLPLVLALGAAVAAVVWFEPPMALRGIGLAQRLQMLWRNRWRALGVGAGLQLAAAVPFVNLLGLGPIATLAACSAFPCFEKSTGKPTQG